MLNIILIATFINLLLFQILIVLLIIGSNLNKTDYEKILEDIEQCKFLKEYEINNSNDKNRYKLKKLNVKCKK